MAPADGRPPHPGMLKQLTASSAQLDELMKSRLDDDDSGSSGGSGDSDRGSDRGSGFDGASARDIDEHGGSGSGSDAAGDARSSRAPSVGSLRSIEEGEVSNLREEYPDDVTAESRKPSSSSSSLAVAAAPAAPAAPAAEAATGVVADERERKTTSLSDTVDAGLPRGGGSERYGAQTNEVLVAGGGRPPSVTAPSYPPGSPSTTVNSSAGAAATAAVASTDGGSRTAAGSWPGAATGEVGTGLRVARKEARRPSRRVSLKAMVQTVRRRSSIILGGASARTYKGRHSGKVSQNMEQVTEGRTGTVHQPKTPLL